MSLQLINNNSSLLLSISDAEPCGPDLEFDPSYELIKNLRNNPSNDLPEGVWERKTAKVNWQIVLDQCNEFLQSKSKDLQVAAWRTESLYELYGIEGFVIGFELVVSLCKTFWGSVYPLPDSLDYSTRTRPIRWLLSESLRKLKSLEQSITHQVLTVASGESPITNLRNLYLELNEFLDLHIPDYAPSFSENLDLIDLILNNSSFINMSDDSVISGSQLETQDVLFSRDKIYQELSSIAYKLSILEPHSPVPFILKEISEWKTVSFEDLLKKLPKDGNSVYDLYKTFSKK
jgi:predicted component of type VI protein secretion system